MVGEGAWAQAPGDPAAGAAGSLPLEAFDGLQGYCRSLGHQVGFDYCRRGGASGSREGLPCRRIRDCWFQRLPVDRYLRAHWRAGSLELLNQPPRGRMAAILEALEAARRGG